MKRISILVACIFVLTTVLVGCKQVEKPDELNQDTVTKLDSAGIELSNKVADAIVNAYLGKSVDTEYAGVLSAVTPMVDDSARIALSTEANLSFEGMLVAAAELPSMMPSSEHFRVPAPGDNVPVIDPNSPLGKLKEAIYPEDAVPNITLMDSTDTPTYAFVTWFLEQTQEAGLVDKRVMLGTDQSIYVIAGDCAPSKGGNTFNIFGTHYTVDDVVTAEDISTSPTYDMQLNSYIYFDNGDYKAVYETDPTGNTSNRLRIEVAFIRSPLGGNNVGIENFIEGVTKIHVGIEGR